MSCWFPSSCWSPRHHASTVELATFGLGYTTFRLNFYIQPDVIYNSFGFSPIWLQDFGTWVCEEVDSNPWVCQELLQQRQWHPLLLCWPSLRPMMRRYN